MKIKTYKLFENPNVITLSKNNYVGWDDSPDRYVFSYYNGDFYCLKDDTHYSLLMQYKDDNIDKKESDFEIYELANGRGEMSGRLFEDEKIITFWKFPKDQEEMRKLVQDLEKCTKLKIWNNDYLVEILIDDSGDIRIPKSYYRKNEDEDEVFFIPVEQYNGSKTRNALDVQMIKHEMSPIEKEKLRKINPNIAKDYWDIRAKKQKPLAYRQKIYQENNTNTMNYIKLFEEFE